MLCIKNSFIKNYKEFEREVCIGLLPLKKYFEVIKKIVKEDMYTR